MPTPILQKSFSKIVLYALATLLLSALSTPLDGTMAVAQMENQHLKVFKKFSFFSIIMEVPEKKFTPINRSAISVDNEYFLEINFRYNEFQQQRRNSALKKIRKKAAKLAIDGTFSTAEHLKKARTYVGLLCAIRA